MGQVTVPHPPPPGALAVGMDKGGGGWTRGGGYKAQEAASTKAQHPSGPNARRYRSVTRIPRHSTGHQHRKALDRSGTSSTTAAEHKPPAPVLPIVDWGHTYEREHPPPPHRGPEGGGNDDGAGTPWPRSGAHRGATAPREACAKTRLWGGRPHRVSPGMGRRSPKRPGPGGGGVGGAKGM